MNQVPEFALEVSGVSKTFAARDGRTLPVISDLSFKIASGSILALLGASGCGKTTLLRMISGVEGLFSGTINSAIQRPGPKLGFMQQGERLLPWLTVIENALHGARLVGNPEFEAINSQELLEQVGMLDFEHAYPRQLSGGMTQRVLLARTLALRPYLLLLDEPFGQLDVLSRRGLSNVVRDYVKQNATAALLVTHSVEEAVMMADEILVLSRRPARIASRFNIGLNSSQADGITLPREKCFDQIHSALLKALANDTGGDL